VQTRCLLSTSTSTGRPWHTPSSGKSQNSSHLDVDARPCASSSTALETAAPPSSYHERLPTSEVVGGTDVPSIEVTEAMDKRSPCRKTEAAPASLKSENISRLSSCNGSSPSDTKCSRVIQDTSLSRSLAAVVGFRELNVSRGSLKLANGLGKMARSTSEVSLSHESESATSNSRLRLKADLQDQQRDANNKMFTSVAMPTSTQHLAPAAARRDLARNEGNVTLRSLDARETRIVSGLLTSLTQDCGSRLASGSCYQLVRGRKVSSSHGSTLPHKSLSTASAAVSQ